MSVDVAGIYCIVGYRHGCIADYSCYIVISGDVALVNRTVAAELCLSAHSADAIRAGYIPVVGTPTEEGIVEEVGIPFRGIPLYTGTAYDSAYTVGTADRTLIAAGSKE